MKISFENLTYIEAGFELDIVIKLDSDQEIARYKKIMSEREYADKDYLRNLAGSELANLRLNAISDIKIAPVPPKPLKLPAASKE